MLKILLNEVRKLAKKQCATFEGKEGCCLRGKCIYFEDDIPAHCRYFIEAVLPIDSELEGEYMKAARKGFLPSDSICEICGQKFEPSNNKQKYCSECATDKKRKYDREFKQKSRGIG